MLVAVAVGFLTATAGLVPLACGGSGGSGGEQASAELSALKADPLGRYEPDGAELVRTDEQNAGTTLGKPFQARYDRLFELPEGDPEQQLQAALDAATDAGWASEGSVFRVSGTLAQSGTKQLSTGPAGMTLTLFVDGTTLGDRASAPALLVSLRHLSA